MENPFKSLDEAFNLTTKNYLDWKFVEGIDYTVEQIQPTSKNTKPLKEIKSSQKILRIENKETTQIIYKNNDSYGMKNYNRIVEDLIFDLLEEQRKLIKQNEPKTKKELEIERSFNHYDNILKRKSYEKYKALRVRPM